MSVEAAGVVRSKPVYAAVPLVLSAGRRLLVAQDATLAEAADLHGQLSADGQALELLSLRDGDGVHDHGDPQLLEMRLLTLLSAAPVGTRLYVCGDESFVWRIYRLARHCGLLAEEIELVKTGSCRELYCVHCATQQSIGSEGEVTCSGCGVRLLVREHFSRRLGAYMGVCLDPDQPHGEGRT